MAEEDDWRPVAPADDWKPVQGAAPEPEFSAITEAGGAGFFQAVRDHVEPVMNAFGAGFTEGWGPERWGMSDENVKWLSKVGVYAPEGATGYSNPFQAMNELLGETLARTGEMFSRGLPASYRATQAAVIEAGVNRDIASIPDAFMGSPHPLGIPKTFPDLPTRVSEIAKGETVPTVAEVAEARSLGVVGPQDRPTINEGTPAEVAARAVENPTEPAPPPETVPKEGSSAYDWQARFEHFVGKIQSSEDVKRLILQSAEENSGFSDARRGELSPSHQETLAQAAGVEPKTVDPNDVGRFLNNEKRVEAAMQIMLTSTDQVLSIAREVATDASDANLIKFQESIFRRDLAVEEVVGLRGEWGRTGNMFQRYMREIKDGEALDQFLGNTCAI